MRRKMFKCKSCGTLYKTKEEALDCIKKDRLINESARNTEKNLDFGTVPLSSTADRVLNSKPDIRTQFIQKVYFSGKGFYLYIPKMASDNAELEDKDLVLVTIEKQPKLKVKIPKDKVVKDLIKINGHKITKKQIKKLEEKGIVVEKD